MTTMTPREIVHELDRHIIGQQDAKRAVAVALRNRWRRMQLDADLRREIVPKNILMIGPTGVGKTEIARRLARLARAPFIKVEATKFTEVGYVGRDVETIIRDLVEIAVKEGRQRQLEMMSDRAEDAAVERILDQLLRQPRDATQPAGEADRTRKILRDKLLAGELDEREIDIETSTRMDVEIMAPPGMEDMSSQLQQMFSQLGHKNQQKQRVKVAEARLRLREEEARKMIDEEEIRRTALQAVAENGIVFIDEIDKVCRRSENTGADVSREGVQRDLLPLIEGCAVTTKYGVIHTDHILFIASGAFHLAKPADLIPELQGRLPIRVELSALTPADFKRILCEPDHSLISQYTALLGVEGLQVEFSSAAIERLAEIAWQVNERTENIGARRLHTVLERLLEDISYHAADLAVERGDSPLVLEAADVDRQLGSLAQNADLSRYIL